MKCKKFEVVLRQVVSESQTEYIADSASEVVKFLNEELEASSSPQERAWAIMTDAPGKIIGYEEVSKGDVAYTVVTPRMVFMPALLTNAVSVILAHNHPSGVPTPSTDDTIMTMRLRDAGKLLGVKLIDSIIVAAGDENNYYSYAENGLLF